MKIFIYPFNARSGEFSNPRDHFGKIFSKLSTAKKPTLSLKSRTKVNLDVEAYGEKRKYC